MRTIPTFEASDGTLIQFIRVNGAPGFSHRVLINREAKDWLGLGFTPSAKAAEFFHEKHKSARAALTPAPDVARAERFQDEAPTG
jgi:hypothetical protein